MMKNATNNLPYSKKRNHSEIDNAVIVINNSTDQKSSPAPSRSQTASKAELNYSHTSHTLDSAKQILRRIKKMKFKRSNSAVDFTSEEKGSVNQIMTMMDESELPHFSNMFYSTTPISRPLPLTPLTIPSSPPLSSSIIISPLSASSSSSSSGLSDEDSQSSQISQSSGSNLNVPISRFFQPAQLFPTLPILEKLFERHNNDELSNDLKNTIFICGQHMLATTGSLFKTLIRLGAKPKNIFAIGKSYSNCEKVIKELKTMGIKVQPTSERKQYGNFAQHYERDIVKLWGTVGNHIKASNKNIKPAKKSPTRIIVLDDGGHVLQNAPEELTGINSKCYIVGIEQTSSGLGKSTNVLPFPIIQVAASAVKNLCEPPMVVNRVGELLVAKLKDYPLFSRFEPRYGVVGVGHIGGAMVDKLLTQSYKSIYIFDQEEQKRIQAREKYKEYKRVIVVESLNTLLASANIIVGCTGKSILNNDSLELLENTDKSKLLLSCSSKDIEFHSLLVDIQQKTRHIEKYPLEDISHTNRAGVDIVVARGGLPINFDNSPHSVPQQDIQLIRGLKLAAVLQAVKMLNDWKSVDYHLMAIDNYQVDASAQLWIFNEWIHQAQKPREEYWKPFIETLSSVESISQASGGMPYISIAEVAHQSMSRPSM